MSSISLVCPACKKENYRYDKQRDFFSCFEYGFEGSLSESSVTYTTATSDEVVARCKALAEFTSCYSANTDGGDQ